MAFFSNLFVATAALMLFSGVTNLLLSSLLSDIVRVRSDYFKIYWCGTSTIKAAQQSEDTG